MIQIMDIMTGKLHMCIVFHALYEIAESVEKIVSSY